MKKGLFVLAGLAFMGMGVTSQVQAKQNVCVFDLLGKAGETFILRRVNVMRFI